MMKLTPSKALKEIGLLKENGCYIKSTVEYKIVETALKRLEKQDEELKTISKNYDSLKEERNILRNQRTHFYLEKEKYNKALEIIKRSPIAVITAIYDFGSWEEYFNYYRDNNFVPRIYSKEEFDLLKEVLK